jgi:hypothetical protein
MLSDQIQLSLHRSRRRLQLLGDFRVLEAFHFPNRDLLEILVAQLFEDTLEVFGHLKRERVDSLKTDPATREDFLKEMRRFLPAATVRDTLAQPAWWTYLTSVLDDQARVALDAL